MDTNRLDEQGRFIIENYSLKDKFASFLPGISGKMGTPIWSFYVNCGQVISSFGVKGKENSIMEFYPAHQAYQLTPLVGFRTFLKIDGAYYEPFFDEQVKKNMYIGMNELEIEEINEEKQLITKVLYYTLPNENIGGLIRKVTLKNSSDKTIEVQLLDGMPVIIPYGVSLDAVKNMGQTAKAWMQVEDIDTHIPYFRVRVSMEDSAVVEEVKGGHFYAAITDRGKHLPVIVDPELVFEYSTTLTKPAGFINKSIGEFFGSKQISQNTMPCAFFGAVTSMEPQEEYSIYSIIGHVSQKEALNEFKVKLEDISYFEEKYKEAVSLTDDICKVIHTQTGNPLFDKYCKQTYLDNVLRGGYPIIIGKNSVYHMYSRKHGDLERDYNKFCMLPEYYSQGNGNFRDVNQNRRCDVFFTPYVKDYNIKTFFNLIQLDGYNPLVINGSVYQVDQEDIDSVLAYVKEPSKLYERLKQLFTPGDLLKYIVENKVELSIPLEEFLENVINVSKQDSDASFGEGYWTDHWTYNLDLIETYLAIYPDEEKRLLFEDYTYTFFESKAIINPRQKRYVITDRGIRQYNAVDHVTKRHVKHNKVKVQYSKGEEYTTTLFSKLMILVTNKFASLDAMGMGIEMEGGKPGWYDALNGMPGLFGSSMAETYELYRVLEFSKTCMDKYEPYLSLPEEIVTFIRHINRQLEHYNEGNLSELGYWDRVNNAKEAYREITKWGISGKNIELNCEYVTGFLNKWLEKLEKGIKRALEYGNGICPTYFAYEVTEYDIEEDGTISPKKFDPIIMPDFLEGPVRFLKINQSKEAKSEVYKSVKNSQLFDKKLNMYKVNASLKDASFEIGRAKAFTPGWLENESIWLHMEYKYLLQMLKSGLYEEFLKDIQTTCIPFLDADVYGRSTLENSSFIVSSANSNTKIHGKGFVARLSGATAEFINIWQIMMFGEKPFTYHDNQLVLEFKPVLPYVLLDQNKQVQCTFLGEILIRYTFITDKDIIPGSYTIREMAITYKDGTHLLVEDTKIQGAIAYDIRTNKVEKIDVTIE